MYAIIDDSGQQFRVQEGDELFVDVREAEDGSTLTFDRVVLVGGGDKTLIGKPHVAGATVTAEVLGHVKAPKLDPLAFWTASAARKRIVLIALFSNSVEKSIKSSRI